MKLTVILSAMMAALASAAAATDTVTVTVTAPAPAESETQGHGGEDCLADGETCEQHGLLGNCCSDFCDQSPGHKTGVCA